MFTSLKIDKHWKGSLRKPSGYEHSKLDCLLQQLGLAVADDPQLRHKDMERGLGQQEDPVHGCEHGAPQTHLHMLHHRPH